MSVADIKGLQNKGVITHIRIDEKSYYVDGHNPSIDNNQKVFNCTILGNDDRNYVYTEAKEYPCRTIA